MTYIRYQTTERRSWSGSG